MLAKQVRNTFKQQIGIVEQQLYDQLEKMKMFEQNSHNNPQCANYISDLLELTSNPIIGSKIIKDQMETLNWQFNSQYELMLEKAELLYRQSLIHDLKKVKSQQKLSYFSQEEVVQMIDDLNWKLGRDEKSILNQSQQIGEIIQINKFFQGVRNYQNMHEELQKQSIYKIKNYAEEVQRQLNMKRGCQLIKMVNLLEKFSQKSQKVLYYKFLTDKKKLKAIEKINYIFFQQYRFSLQKIKEQSRRQTPRQYFNKLFTKKINQQGLTYLLPIARTLTDKHNKVKNMCTCLQKLIIKKIRICGCELFKKIDKRIITKMHKYSQLFKKMDTVCKIVGFRSMIKAIGIKQHLFVKIVSKIEKKNLKLGFQSSLFLSEDKKKRRLMVSEKVKGKLLKYVMQNVRNSKPIDLKKVFLDWYIKGNQRKYTKMIYNIWLNGSIGKFTFFMRLKNLIDESRQYKIKYELKLFLMVMIDKYDHYYKFTQKGFLHKWYKNTKAIKNKQINTEKAKFLLTAVMNRVLDQQKRKLAEVFNDFRQNRQLAKTKKLNVFTKAFSRGSLRLQKYFLLWKANKNLSLMTQTNMENTKWIFRKVEIKNLQHFVSHRQKQSIIEAVSKFYILTKQKIQKRLQFKKFIINFIEKQEQQLKRQTYKIFLANNSEGKEKKQQLVLGLASATNIKLSRAIGMWKQQSEKMKENQKIIRARELFQIIFSRMQDDHSIYFSNKYTAKCLNKIIVIKRQNAMIALKKLISLPLRINWSQRKSLIQMVTKINSINHQNQSNSFQIFKRDHLEGNFKKKISLNFIDKFYRKTAKLFMDKYRTNVKQIIAGQKSKLFVAFFQNTHQGVANSFSYIYLKKSEWGQKKEALSKLNQWAIKKLLSGFHLWLQTSKKIVHFNALSNKQKKRCLQILSNSMNKNLNQGAKDIIQRFRKNHSIITFQKHFLKKMLDSQVGKVVKAFQVIKSLPQLKNRQLIVKATLFEKKLSQFVNKTLRQTMNTFSEQYYIGREKKRLIARMLINQYSLEVRSYLQKWRSIKDRSKLFSKCHKVQNLLSQCTQICYEDFKILLVGDKSKKIKKCIILMIQTWKNSQKSIIKSWLTNSYLGKVKDQAKSGSIKTIEFLIKKNQNQTRNIGVKKFIQVMKRSIFIKSFLEKYYLKSRKVSIFFSISLMKKLPDWKRQEKKRSMLKSLSILDKKQNQNIHQTFEKFRKNKYQGQFKKQRAFGNWLQNKIEQVSCVLRIWNQCTILDKENKKHNLMSSTFHCFDEITRSNFQQIMMNRRQYQVKKRALEKLFKVQQIKRNGFFKLWKQNIEDWKMIQKLNNKTKMMVIQKMSKMVESTSDVKVQQTIKNFYLNFRIVQVQRKFINRLLNTKSGKVLQAFNVWKELPNQNLGEKYKKAQKFYFKLEGFLRSRLMETFYAYKSHLQEGNVMKKQSILRMFETTNSGIRKFYNRWSLMTKKNLTIQTVKQTIKWMDILEETVANQFLIIFENQRSYKIKVAAIEKLIAACGETTRSYLTIWRKKVQQIKIMQGLDKDKQKLAIGFFNSALNKSNNSQLSQIIQKFKINRSVYIVSRNFFNKLLQTKTGKVLKIMQIWKSIPNAKIAKKKKLAIIFQSKLHKLLVKNINFLWKPFKQQSLEANNKKRYCIQRLIKLSQSDIRNKFDLWRNIIKEVKFIENSKALQNIFLIPTQALKNSFQMLIQDCKFQITSKKNLCKKLITNSNFVLHHAYFVWKQAYQIDNIKITKQQSKVKNILNNFIHIFSNCQNKKAVRFIDQMRKIADQRVLQKYLKEKNIQNQQKNLNCLKIMQGINKHFLKQYGLFINQIKTQQLQKILVNKIKSIEESFQIMSFVQTNNFLLLMRNNRQSFVMQKALEKLFQNCGKNIQKVFDIWRECSMIQKMKQGISNEKKKNLLTLISRAVDGHQTRQIPFAIKQFQKNLRMITLQKEILTKILQCKAGKVPLTFMLWKSLPNPGAKKQKQLAMKFESGLSRLHMRKIKIIYEKFKDEHYDGNVKKKYAIRKLVLVTMSDSNRMFQKWRKIVGQIKVTQTVSLLQQFSQNLTSIVKLNMTSLIDNAKIHNKIKLDAVRTIFKRQEIIQSEVFKNWKQLIQEDKLYYFQKVLNKFDPFLFNKKVVKSAFQSIKKTYQLDTLRNYINSLWKWKSSNTQAYFTSKMVKVYKQNHTLVLLTNSFNKKKEDLLHYSYRRILSEGNERNSRKIRITEKYLTKKLNYYFQVFKFNTVKSEIEIWKNKFTEIILSFNILKKIQLLHRKEMLQFFNKIKNYNHYHENVGQFVSKVQKFAQNQQKEGFKKLKQLVPRTFIEAIQKFHGTYHEKRLRLIFSFLVNYYKIDKIRDSITKLLHFSSLRQSFISIKRRSNRNLKCKLSISLVNKIYGNIERMKAMQFICKFKKQFQMKQKLTKMVQKLNKVIQRSERQIFQINHDMQKNELVLKRFRNGTAVKKILEKHVKKVLKLYLMKLAKKQNPWISRAIKSLATKASIQSSIAISFWRMKQFVIAKQQN